MIFFPTGNPFQGRYSDSFISPTITYIAFMFQAYNLLRYSYALFLWSGSCCFYWLKNIVFKQQQIFRSPINKAMWVKDSGEWLGAPTCEPLPELSSETPPWRPGLCGWQFRNHFSRFLNCQLLLTSSTKTLLVSKSLDMNVTFFYLTH